MKRANKRRGSMEKKERKRRVTTKRINMRRGHKKKKTN